jgi:hypothetical protein
LQSPKIIEKLFADGIFQKDELSFLTNQITEHHIIKVTNAKSTTTNLRFIIDPNQGIQDLIKRKIRAI